MIWNLEIFKVRENFQGARWVIVVSELGNLGWSCAIGIVYGSHTLESNLSIYDEINHVKTLLTCPLKIW